MTTIQLELLLKEDFGNLSIREKSIAIKAAELYRDNMISHWNELKEKAATATLQGVCSIPETIRDYPEEQIAQLAIQQADVFVNMLKNNSIIHEIKK